MGGSPGDVGQVPVTKVKQREGCRMSCDVGEATEGLENELWHGWSDEGLENEAEHGRLARWRKWRACDIGQAKEGLENELWRR